MERFNEITLAELCESILKNELNDIYFKARNGNICRNSNSEWELSELKTKQWFKRVVIE